MGQYIFPDVDMIEFQHELLEAIDTVSQAITTRAIMPPFAATGFIAGDSHIKTFDGKFYQFAGAKGKLKIVLYCNFFI